jgi:hypothetical protein
LTAVVSKKTVLLALLVIVLVSIAIRYPMVEHERNQTDSYFMHLLSQSIVDNGYAKWTFHPLSYLGYYPFSYPSGAPFLLAEVSSLTGINMEASILLLDFMMAIMFALGVFGLARQFLRRPEYVLLATLFAAVGPRFVDTSTWDASARGLFVVLVTFAAFISFRAAATGQRNLFFVTGLVVIGCFATHHMAVLLLILALGYLMAAFLIHFALRRVLPNKRGTVAASVLLVVLVAGLVLLSVLEYFEPLGFYALGEGGFFDINPPALSIVLNLAVSFTHQVGFVLLFAFLSVPYIFKNFRLRTETLYLIALPIAFVPLLGNSIYVSMLLSPFIAILGTEWFRRHRESSRRKLGVSCVLVLLIASSVALPVWSTHRWNSTEYLSGENVLLPDQVFNDANYMHSQVTGLPAISNDYVITNPLAATSGIAFLSSGIQMVLSGDINYDDIRRNVTWSGSDFPRNLYVWFEYPSQDIVGQNIFVLMVVGVVFVQSPQTYYHGATYFSTHPKLVVAVDNLWPTHYIDQYSINNSNFLVEIQRSTAMNHQEFSSYKNYQSEYLTLYLVELPL